jgi:hypothetical protein
LLKVKPVIQFDDQGPVFGPPEFHCIIIGVYHIEVGHGGKTPLKPAVDVEIILLGIVLQKGGPEQRPGEVYFDSRPDQKEVVRTIWIGEAKVVLLEVNGEVPPGLGPEDDSCHILDPDTIVESPVGEACFNTEQTALIGFEAHLPLGVSVYPRRKWLFINKGERKKEIYYIVVHYHL